MGFNAVQIISIIPKSYFYSIAIIQIEDNSFRNCQPNHQLRVCIHVSNDLWIFLNYCTFQLLDHSMTSDSLLEFEQIFVLIPNCK